MRYSLSVWNVNLAKSIVKSLILSKVLSNVSKGLCRSGSRLSTARMCCWFFLLADVYIGQVHAQSLYEIAVEKIAIYEQPNTQSKVVNRLYQASDVQLLTVQSKWVEVRFQHQGRDIVGWIDKKHLSFKKSLLDSPQHSELNQSVKEQPINPSAEGQQATIDLEKYSARAINADIYCSKILKTKQVSGCVVDVDVEIKGSLTASVARVVCEAGLVMQLADDSVKERRQRKAIRTPLKKGEGAARVQLAVIPLIDAQVHAVKLQSYQCQLQNLL